MVDVKVKLLHKDAVLPARQKAGDAGYDLVATSMKHDDNDPFLEFGTGLAFEIPPGFVGKIYPRSSISKKNTHLCNNVAIIDSNYRGEVKLRFKKLSAFIGRDDYKVGDRIGQLIILPLPEVKFLEVDELGSSDRGDGAFGSSGN